MAKDEKINVRVDSDLKKDVEYVLKTLGMNVSDAVNIYFKMITLKRGLPFEVTIPNDVTIAAMQDALNGVGDSYQNEQEMLEDSDNW